MTTDGTVTVLRVPSWTLGDRMRKARESAGLQQADLASEIGIARNSVSNYELGRTSPNRPVLEAWARRTAVPLDWLMTGASDQASTSVATLVDAASARSSTDRASDYGSEVGRFRSPFRRASHGRRRTDRRDAVIYLFAHNAALDETPAPFATHRSATHGA